MRGRFRLVPFALAFGLLTAPAWADGDPAAAKKFFESGRKARDEGFCQHAIDEFQRSVAADPSIGAYYNIGFCQEQLGHRQEAYEAYRRAKDLSSTKKDDRIKEISGALAALLETPNIRLVLPQPLPDGFKLLVDGEEVPSQFLLQETVVFTKAAPVHEVFVQATGFDNLKSMVETRQLKTIELAKAGTSATPPPPPPPPKRYVTIYTWSWQRYGGIALMGVGAGLATIGAVMLISYKADERANQQTVDNVVKNECHQDIDFCKTSANPKFLQAATHYNNREDRATSDAPIMAATLIGGALAIGGGVALFLTAKDVPHLHDQLAKSKLEVTPMLGPDRRGLAISGAF